MYRLSNDQIPRWKKEASVFLPSSIDSQCPECGRLVSFATAKWSPAPQNTRIAVVRCPACQTPAMFFLLNHKGEAGTLGSGEQLYIHAKPPGREALPEIVDGEGLDDPLKRAYVSAVNVFNTQEWGATAVLTRRLLEGVTKSLLPPEYQSLPLAKQVAKLPETKDLSEPILKIADAIRKGGNLGAHFDLEAEPTQEVSQLMLDLAEELIEYFFVLPARIEELHDKIEDLNGTRS